MTLKPEQPRDVYKGSRWWVDPTKDLRQLAEAVLKAPRPFCPCEVNEPQACQPEKWPGAHTPYYLTREGEAFVQQATPARVLSLLEDLERAKA